MRGILIILLSSCITLFPSCKKEIGKKEYIMSFEFESGHKIELSGKIFEKDKKNKKYRAKIGYGYSITDIEKLGLYLDFTNDNETMAIKSNDQKLYCNDHWEFWNNFPLINQSGKAKGDIYLEGNYTQKGRAYSVEDGVFEFYWRNASDFGMNDTILKGKWTLKRK